ncbi:hypothetical protein TYRP_011970 [Tyrophagus putrescentiae]|nr:hypothetical protein TYRP_011970 [Tyrophagus putrescentiae]
MALGVLASVNGIPIFAILSILATQLLSFLIAFKKRVLSCVSILGAKKTGTTGIILSIMARSFQHFFAHNAAFLCLLADANRLYGSLMYFFFTAYPFNAKLLMSIFLQKLSFSATIGISTLLIQQLFLMFALQLFCARMAIAFHRPVKPMMAIFMQLNRSLSNSSFVLRVRLKVAYYLQHFHVNNRLQTLLNYAAQYTKEVRQTLKDELHKDLVGLQQTLSDEKEFAELEKDLNEIIDSPDAIVSVVDEFSKQYSDKGFDPK